MMPERTTAVKRATETKEYDVSTKELITASIGTFQDLGVSGKKRKYKTRKRRKTIFI